MHGELVTLGITVAPCTVWEILRAAGIDPAPDRAATTWTDVQRFQAEALLAADVIETVTLTGARMSILAVIEPAVSGSWAAPPTRLRRGWYRPAGTSSWTCRTPGRRARYLIRDRDRKYPALFDTILADAGITIVHSGVQLPRMNAIMKRWVRTCRRELPDRTLVCNQRHLLQTLREFEIFSNEHRPHHGMANARPLAPLPERITDTDRLGRRTIQRRDRLGGVLHEYAHAA